MSLLSNINDNKYKISDYLKQIFPQIYNFKFSGEIYLIGGAVRDIIEDKPPKDLDLILLSDNPNIEEFLIENRLEYRKNSFDGYKILFKNITIDMWAVNDILKAIQYNLDGLMYNVKYDIIIPFGYIDGMEKKRLIVLNSNNEHPDAERRRNRKEKLLRLVLNRKNNINDDKHENVSKLEEVDNFLKNKDIYIDKFLNVNRDTLPDVDIDIKQNNN